MKIVRCNNGHFYDTDIHSHCPYCKDNEKDNSYAGNEIIKEEKGESSRTPDEDDRTEILVDEQIGQSAFYSDTENNLNNDERIRKKADNLCPGCMNELTTAEGNFCPKCGYRFNDSNIVRGLQPRTILNGKYIVGKVIGEGGFGITYIGFDNTLHSCVAIKEYFPVELASRDTSTGVQTSLSVLTGSKEEQFKRGIERFVNEASNLAKFNDLPGIVSVRDFFYENNTAYMVMEYIDGVTLSEYLKQNGNKLPYQKVLDMMKPVMDSLQKVHEAGIIHRDISPDNIMVTKDGELKLIDFGAARFIGNEDQKSFTVILKHGYAPEEQYQTDGKQGPWTDVYALAATMYRMITGIVPQEATERILSDDNLVPINKLISEIPKTRSEAIMHCLAVKSENRYKDIDEFKQGLFDGKQKPTSIRIIIPIIVMLAVAATLGLILRSPQNSSKEVQEVLSSTNDSNPIEDKDESPQNLVEKENTSANNKEEGSGADNESDKLEQTTAFSPKTEGEMRGCIEILTGQEMWDIQYDDFDGDGSKEMFASYSDSYWYEVYYGGGGFGGWEKRTKLVTWFANSERVQEVGFTYVYDDIDRVVNNIHIVEDGNLKKYVVDEDHIYSFDGEIPKQESSDYNICWAEVEDREDGLEELTEEESINIIKEKSGQFPFYYKYDDFDGDGIYEIIAFCGIQEGTYDVYSDVSIWAANSRSVVDLSKLQGYRDIAFGGYISDLDDIKVVKFGKIKQIAVNEWVSPYNVRFYTCGFISHKPYAVESFDASGFLEEIDGMPCINGTPAYFVDGAYYKYGLTRLNERFFGEIDNSRELMNETQEKIDKLIIIDRWGENVTYPYRVKTDMYFSAEDKIYVNYDCWNSKNDYETLKDLLNNKSYIEIQEINEENPDLYPTEHAYCHAVLTYDEGIAEFDSAESDDIANDNDSIAYYPNMIVFLKNVNSNDLPKYDSESINIDTAGEESRKLNISYVEASTILNVASKDHATYDANNVCDGNYKTAWVEGGRWKR